MASLKANGFSPEPYFARPPADVMEPRIPQTVPDHTDANIIAENSNLYKLKNFYQPINDQE